MIRVLIVEDSPLIAVMMRDMLADDSEISVVGWAKNGQEAIDLRESLNPTVITMDLNMPLLSGLEAIRAICSSRPVPIIVVSGLIDGPDSELAFKALQSGAVDIMNKPEARGAQGFSRIKEELISRVKSAARIRPFYPKSNTLKQNPAGKKNSASPMDGLLAIGASTGGPPALVTLLKALPRSFPYPIAVVQHITPGFLGGLVRWMERETGFSVKVSTQRETLRPGTVYLADDNQHLEIGPEKNVLLTHRPPVHGHRPSADRLLESAAGVYGQHTIGVLLTGIGSDGAEGLKKVRDARGKTIVQDEATCLVFGMPKSAILKGAAEVVCPLERIAEEILLGLSKGREA